MQTLLINDLNFDPNGLIRMYWLIEKFQNLIADKLKYSGAKYGQAFGLEQEELVV